MSLVTNLTAAQADGLACVVCGVNYLTASVNSVPVGRSHTGAQVFACAGCVPSTDCKERDSFPSWLAGMALVPASFALAGLLVYLVHVLLGGLW